jgi:hypothetical protein
MHNKVITFAAAVVMVLGFSQASVAGDEEAGTATLVVYRADESVKTERLNLDLHVGKGSMGRLKAENAIIITRPAGEYALGTSIRGTKGIVIDLKPGQTHYVLTEMDLRGTRLKVKMVEVEEQVAKLQQPQLDQVI